MPPSTIAIHSPTCGQALCDVEAYYSSKRSVNKIDKKGQPTIHVRFSQQRDYTSGTKFRVSRAQFNCGVCPFRSQCTRAKTEPRSLTIQTKQEYTALHNRREVQFTPKFLKTYNQRAGIEGTISQGVRHSALRQSRYIGLAKTHLQHIFMAAGLNLCRLDNWLNSVPLATTRYSGFMTLKPKAS